MVEDLSRWSHLSADAQVLRQQAHGVRHDGRGQEQQKTFRWIDLLYFMLLTSDVKFGTAVHVLYI